MPSKASIPFMIDSLGMLASLAEAVPALGAPIKGSVEALKQILQFAQQVKNNKEDSLGLAEHARDVTYKLFDALQSLDNLDSMRMNIESYIQTLRNIAIFSKQRAERSSWERTFNKQNDADEIKKWEKSLTRAFELFNMNALIDIKTHAVAAHTLDMEGFQRNLLDRLRPIKTAFHDHTEAAPACLQGTRVNLLADITTWMTNETSETVYWLSGTAGTGKTTVAQSVAIIAKELGFLTATFFFSHLSDDRRSFGHVIPTLAYQLGKSKGLRPRVCEGIQSDDDIAIRPVRTQALKLLADVLTPLPSDLPPCLLIVLDALDECKEDANKIHGGDLIPVLAATLKNLPFAKLFITSRPESSIERLFTRGNVFGDTLPLVLHHDIPKETVQDDIERYLKAELIKLRQENSLPSSFPHESDVQTLVQRADGLFIYARTAVEFISNPDSTPAHRLAALIRSQPADLHGQYERLDNLYCQILLKALRITPWNRHTADPDLRNILVVLALSKEELPSDLLAAVADVDEHRCNEFLRRISAVLNYRPHTEDPVRVMHLSFSDYLSNPKRCLDLPAYAVKISGDHLRITERCLEVMKKHLRYDICNIINSGLFNHEIPDLQHRLAQCIPGVLRYACKFWVIHWLEHIRAVGVHYQAPTHLIEFCNRHLFNWIELSSLLGAVDTVGSALSELNVVLDQHVHLRDRTIRNLLSDARSLMREYRIPITLGALQVYHSGLASMPETLLRQKALGIPTVRLTSERDQEWQQGALLLEGHANVVRAVAIFSNDSQIASASHDCTIRIWDAISGTHQRILTGHTGAITSIAVSFNDSHIVSGSHDATVRMWNCFTGQNTVTLTGHMDGVDCVAFSPTGSQIISGSSDKTVRVWDSVLGLHQRTLTGHTSGVSAVAMSPDSMRIASGSGDRMVRIWDATSGMHLFSLIGHTGPVTSVAFSPNGAVILSGSWDRTVRTWEALSGVQQLLLDGHDSGVNSVAFSSDGSQIVSGCWQYAIRVWDAITGSLRHTLMGHTDAISSVTFSVSGSQIISGAYDGTARIWDLVSGASHHRLDGHLGEITCVSLTLDGLLAVSSSSDTTVQLWGTQSGIRERTLTGHADIVNSVAISADGSRIVSGSDDTSVQVWNAGSGRRIHTLNGHTDRVTCVAISAEDSLVVSGSFDTTVRVWDAALGIHRYTLIGHSGPVTCIACAAKGSLVLSGSWDHTVRIWDAASGTHQHTLEGHTDRVNFVAFSMNDTHIISGSEDGTMRVWEPRAVSLLQVFDDFLSSKDTSQAFDVRAQLKKAMLLDEYHVNEHGPGPKFTLDAMQGWIFRRENDGVWRRMCWLPHARRHGGLLQSRGQRVCIGAMSGIMTILDFSDV